MSFTAKSIPFETTRSFSNLVNDYLAGNEKLSPFYEFTPDEQGMENAINARKQFPVDRALLHENVKKLYEAVTINERLQKNIESLQSDNCFTICTAHQPNIFTGHLYFIYKILHAVKLAEELSAKHADHDFFPLYYMGSEDADIQELGELDISGKHYQWATNQKGAVGRMKVDEALIKIIEEVALQIEVLPFGFDIIAKMRACYAIGCSIEKATFAFVHSLLGNYGVVIILPDSDDFKRAFLPIVEKELSEQFSNKAVTSTIKDFPGEYKIQTEGREINLFFLEANQRERVQLLDGKFSIDGIDGDLTKSELMEKFAEHPARISPNVVLRPLFQEIILPNIVFIGGGGELAYWLELKTAFAAANVFFPVLMLRNSFMLMTKETELLQARLQVDDEALFLPVDVIFNEWIRKNADKQLLLESEKQKISEQFKKIKKIAIEHDVTLNKHIEALETTALNKLSILEKKILKAARSREAATLRQIEKMKTAVFPNGSLQERVDNIVFWHAVYGNEILDTINKNSTGSISSFQIIKAD